MRACTPVHKTSDINYVLLTSYSFNGAYPATEGEGGGGGGLGRAVPRCRHIGCVVSHGATAVSSFCVVLCYALLCSVVRHWILPL